MDLVIWIGAGIAALVFASWRLTRRRARERALIALCRRVGLGFAATDPFPDTLWMPFGWLGPGSWISAENVIWNASDGPELRAFDLLTEERGATEDATPTHHRFSCAAVPLPFGCRRLEIRPRDKLDGVLDPIVGEDVQLELEPFNRRFRVRCDDRRFAVAFCDQRMMRAMLTLPAGVTVAVNEDHMLLRAGLLPPAQVLLLFEAARALRKVVPPVVASLYPPRQTEGPHEDRWLQGHWSPEAIGDHEA